jgi:chromosome partitioning protein
MTAVAMINRKGGVGKTTLLLALADFLSVNHARKVLVIDLDPQANATFGLIGEDAWAVADRGRRTVADVFEAFSRDGAASDVVQANVSSVRGHGRGTIDLIPGSPRLQEAEDELMDPRANWKYRTVGPYLVLAAYAESLGLKKRYDTILIDCPPAMGAATINGLTLADGFIVPVMPTNVSVVGVSQVVARIRDHERDSRRTIKHHGTVVNAFHSVNRSHNLILEEIRSKTEFQPLWSTVVPRATQAERGWSPDAEARTLIQRWGGGNSRTPLYTALESLAAEFLRRIG